VKEFVETSFDYVGLNWKKHVKFDPRYLRPTEVDYLKGDASKARKTFGWKNETSFLDLVKRMVDHDLDLAEREKKRDS
jgi:GDPmannose 4,6-dehydratase